MNGTALDDTTANAIDRAAQGSAIDSERSAAQADQTAADADQTASDADQTASDRDEADAISDQRVADLDQARADLNAPSATTDNKRARFLARVARGYPSQPPGYSWNSDGHRPYQASRRCGPRRHGARS